MSTRKISRHSSPPCGRRVSTQFLVFPISTRVDITVYQHGKCFIFLKYKYASLGSLDHAKIKGLTMERDKKTKKMVEDV